jgi:hypothetical protein
VSRRRIVRLCPAAEKIIREIPTYIGLTGDALRATVERCVKAQRKWDTKDEGKPIPGAWANDYAED